MFIETHCKMPILIKGRTHFAFQLAKVRRFTGNLASNRFSSMNPGPPLAFSVKSFMRPFKNTLSKIITDTFFERVANSQACL